MKAFKTVKLTTEELTNLTQTIKNSFEDKKHNTKELLSFYQSEYTKATNRIEKLWDDKYDGKISEEEHSKRLRRYKDQQEKAKAKIDGLEKADDEYYLLAERILHLISRAGEIYESSEIDQKRELLKMSFQNLDLDGLYLK